MFTVYLLDLFTNLFTHINPTDYFHQPSIYLAYQNGIIGPSALESTNLFAIYGLASGENKDFVTQVPKIYPLLRFIKGGRCNGRVLA